MRNLEFFADFCMRAAYYLHLPARGPVPLPRITERWTVPRANFIFKKSQENFERITMRRLIQIQDGDPDVVSAWLNFIKKHQYYGVGMKANVWTFEGIDVDKELERVAGVAEKGLEGLWERFGRKKGEDTGRRAMELLNDTAFKDGAKFGAMGAARSV